MSSHHGLSVVSLFTGAGGLDLGLEAAGFRITICVESDDDARSSIRTNRPRWKLAEPKDVFEIAPRALLEQTGLRPKEAALLVGGPPCQPFSKSTYWANGRAPGISDPRAGTLSALLKIANMVLPRAILIENVRGLLSSAGQNVSGLDLLETGLERINSWNSTKYRPQVLHMNAADFGVPQIRERIFIVASIDGKLFDTPNQPMATVKDWNPIGPHGMQLVIWMMTNSLRILSQQASGQS